MFKLSTLLVFLYIFSTAFGGVKYKVKPNRFPGGRSGGSAERDRFRDFYGVSEMLDGNENAWDVVERRERMAQAIYET